MSYIEKKYNSKIKETFNKQIELEKALIIELERKSVNNINEIAQLCAQFNHNINLILKKYYPEIKEMNDKLQIKSTLKFYYDLIFKLTDLVRNIDNYQRIDPEYYEKLIQFIQEKDKLIAGKYKNICTQELTAFYDQNSRDNLEKILLEKIESKSRQFFSFGSLEEEIKKIARLSGAASVMISVADELSKEELESAQSIIIFDSGEQFDFMRLDKIGQNIKHCLISKNYKCILKEDTIITDAKLLPD
ncbi:MAG: hypothetical protein ACFFEY_05370 [Candidatus Thorarchaeota archaeon]